MMIKTTRKTQQDFCKSFYRRHIVRACGLLTVAFAVGFSNHADAQKKTKNGNTRARQRASKPAKTPWINHYLSADRNKILGGVWKFVSTEDDEYYYRPSSPLMLEQPAGRVIGFASAADAEEAGYLPADNISANDRLSVLQRDIDILEATPFPPQPDRTEKEAKQLISLVVSSDSSDYPLLKALIARWVNSSSQRSGDRFGVHAALTDAMRNIDFSSNSAKASIGIAYYYAKNKNPTYVKVDREKAKTAHTQPK